MDLRLKDRVAIVTGGARRGHVGRQIALRLAEEGAQVAFTYLSSSEDAAATQADLSLRSGADTLAFRVDVTNPEEVRRCVEEVEARLGPIDIVVNNAGHNEKIAFFWETDDEEWMKSFGVFTFGAMTLCKCVLPGMIERRHGKIINLAGDAGKVGEVRRSITAAARAATMAFTKSLAREVGRYDINVNAVSLGLVEEDDRTGSLPTETLEKIVRQYPLRRLGRPDDVAPLVALLASDLSSWMTGQILSVSGGYTMA